MKLLELTLKDEYSVSEIRELLEEGCDVNETDANGQTCLHNVSVDNNVECAKYLLVSGAKVNSVNRAGTTPLMCCVMSNKFNWQYFSLLIKFGAKTTIVDSDGWDIVKYSKKRKTTKYEEHLFQYFRWKKNLGIKEKELINSIDKSDCEFIMANYLCIDRDFLFNYVRIYDIQKITIPRNQIPQPQSRLDWIGFNIKVNADIVDHFREYYDNNQLKEAYLELSYNLINPGFFSLKIASAYIDIFESILKKTNDDSLIYLVSEQIKIMESIKEHLNSLM